MVKKSIAIYGDISVQSPFNTDQLVIEISNYHIACLVKMAAKDELSAIEVFTFNSEENTWYEIFQTIRAKSRVLDRGFINTKVYLNLPETILVPEEKNAPAAVEQYIELIHGDLINQIIKTDTTINKPVITVATKIKRTLSDSINSSLMMITSKNSHTVFIDNLVNPERPYNHTLLKLQIYPNEMLVGLTHHGALLLTQLYTQLTQEDVLYNLLNILQQFNLKTNETTLEISGMIEQKTSLFENLKKVFSKITFDNVDEEEVFSDDFKKFPKHYFTPYMQLLKA